MQETPHTSPFDAIRKVDGRSNEYWSARELYKILGYSEWRNFNNVVIKRAMKACEENGRAIKDHFVQSSNQQRASRTCNATNKNVSSGSDSHLCSMRSE